MAAKGKENSLPQPELNIDSSLDILLPTPPGVNQSATNLKRTVLAPSTASAPAPKKKKVSYTHEVVDGWIHCRVPVKMSPLYDFSLTSASKKQRKRTPSAPGELHKDKRYPCPDCKKWYGDNDNHIQRSCRHRVRSETDEELKMWDISFSDDD